MCTTSSGKYIFKVCMSNIVMVVVFFIPPDQNIQYIKSSLNHNNVLLDTQYKKMCILTSNGKI